MVKKNKIMCPFCKNDTGLTMEGFMYRLVEKNIKCPHCRKVVIHANRAEYKTKEISVEYKTKEISYHAS